MRKVNQPITDSCEKDFSLYDLLQRLSIILARWNWKIKYAEEERPSITFTQRKFRKLSSDNT